MPPPDSRGWLCSLQEMAASRGPASSVVTQRTPGARFRSAYAPSGYRARGGHGPFLGPRPKALEASWPMEAVQS